MDLKELVRRWQKGLNLRQIANPSRRSRVTVSRNVAAARKLFTSNTAARRIHKPHHVARFPVARPNCIRVAVSYE